MLSFFFSHFPTSEGTNIPLAYAHVLVFCIQLETTPLSARRRPRSPHTVRQALLWSSPMIHQLFYLHIVGLLLLADCLEVGCRLAGHRVSQIAWTPCAHAPLIDTLRHLSLGIAVEWNSILLHSILLSVPSNMPLLVLTCTSETTSRSIQGKF